MNGAKAPLPSSYELSTRNKRILVSAAVLSTVFILIGLIATGNTSTGRSAARGVGIGGRATPGSVVGYQVAAVQPDMSHLLVQAVKRQVVHAAATARAARIDAVARAAPETGLVAAGSHKDHLGAAVMWIARHPGDTFCIGALLLPFALIGLVSIVGGGRGRRCGALAVRATPSEFPSPVAVNFSIAQPKDVANSEGTGPTHPATRGDSR